MRRTRKNASSDNTMWIVGGAVTLVVVLGVLASRSAHAEVVPPPLPPLPPPPPPPIPMSPHPRPRPAPTTSTPSTLYPEIVRQGSLDSPTSPTVIRVLQQQLKDLGYTITDIDGIPGPELRQATLDFENDYDLSPYTPNLDLLLAVDTRYGQVFDPINRHQH